MSTTTAKTFTLGELAKIALGSRVLTKDHLNVLKGLLIIILQKLNCHNENVSIKGFSIQQIQALLKDAENQKQYNFQLKTVKKFKEKYDLLEDLECKNQEIDSKLEQHFEQIRNYHKTNIFEATLWDYYASSDEDLCTLYMHGNKEICFLVRNPVFNKELRLRAAQLMVERLKEFEKEIVKMHNKLKEVMDLSKKAAMKQNCIQYIIKDIENIRETLDKNNNTFREAMEETQEMFNCKLDRVALPALKKYLEYNFANIKEDLRILHIQRSKCAIIKPLILDNNIKCLSCGRQGKKKVNKTDQALNSRDLKPKCFCHNLHLEPTILQKIDRMKLIGHKLKVLTNVVSSAHRLSRQSDTRRNKLHLVSQGILTNYGSAFMLSTEATTISKSTILKTSLKKPKEPSIKERSNSLDSRRFRKSLSFGKITVPEPLIKMTKF